MFFPWFTFSVKTCFGEIKGSNNFTKCGISNDGTWQRRGYSSLNGCVSVISVDPGKILDIELMSQYCHICAKCNSQPSKHACSNYKGSAGNMEVVGAYRKFEPSNLGLKTPRKDDESRRVDTPLQRRNQQRTLQRRNQQRTLQRRNQQRKLQRRNQQRMLQQRNQQSIDIKNKRTNVKYDFPTSNKNDMCSDNKFQNKGMRKTAKINGYDFDALIDTGSTITLIRESVYQILGRPMLHSTKTKLTSFGKKELIEWCMKEGLIASSYECPKCNDQHDVTWSAIKRFLRNRASHGKCMFDHYLAE
ncbi:uncharacterized protein TNCV_167241 [Trichonephila clavipes]|nr:uncharacterized protein TNCV_167241 [Trichonephila clavipes]